MYILSFSDAVTSDLSTSFSVLFLALGLTVIY